MAEITKLLAAENTERHQTGDCLGADARAGAYSGEGDARAGRTGNKPTEPTWAQHALTALQGAKVIEQLGNNHQTIPPELIRETNQHFQQALVEAQKAGTTAKGNEIEALYNFHQTDAVINGPSFLKNPQFVEMLKKAGISTKPELSSAEIQSALGSLGTRDQQPGADKQQIAAIRDYLDLQALRNFHKAQAQAGLQGSNAAPMVAMMYADFLLNPNVGGAARLGKDGPVVTAADIITKANSGRGDIIDPQIANKMMERFKALEQQASTACGVTTNNPLAMLDELNGRQPADIKGYQAAYDLAHKPDFASNVQGQIKRVMDTPVSANFTQQQKDILLKSLNTELQHSQGLTAMFLGNALMQGEHPDFAKIQQLYEEAGQDDMARGIRHNGQPLLETLKAQADVQSWSQKTIGQGLTDTLHMPEFQKALVNAQQELVAVNNLTKEPTAVNLQQAAAKAAEYGHDAGAVAAMLKPYKDTIDSAFSKMYESLKGKSEKEVTQQEKDQFNYLKSLHDMAHMDTQAKLVDASLDVLGENPNRAIGKLNDLQAADRDYVNHDITGFKQRFDALMDQAKTLRDARDSGFTWLLDKGGEALDWLANHPKTVVAVAAVIGATVVTGGVALAALGVGGAVGAGAAGIAATVGAVAEVTGVSATTAAIGTSIVAGTGLGTAAGALADVRSGEAGSLWQGATNHVGEAAGWATTVAFTPTMLAGGGAGVAGSAAKGGLFRGIVSRIPGGGSVLGAWDAGAGAIGSRAVGQFSAALPRYEIASAVAPRVTSALTPYLGRFAPGIGARVAGAAQVGSVVGMLDAPKWATDPKGAAADVSTALVFGGMAPWIGKPGSTGISAGGRIARWAGRWAAFTAADYAANAAFHGDNAFSYTFRNPSGMLIDGGDVFNTAMWSGVLKHNPYLMTFLQNHYKHDDD